MFAIGPYAAPEWQAGSLRRHSTMLMVACPLEGNVGLMLERQNLRITRFLIFMSSGIGLIKFHYYFLEDRINI